MSFLARIFGALALCLLSVLPALAQFLSADEVADVSFMPGYRLSGDRHMAAIRIDLAPGWKTYWRAPGEGGVPTRLQLTTAEGISGFTIHWPRPQVFFTNGLRSIGYQGSVVLPIEFETTTNGIAGMNGHLDFGVCQDVCMPISVDLGGLMPPIFERDGAIAAALADRPYTSAEAGAGAVTCTVAPISDGLRVAVQVQVPDVGNDETIVVEHRDPMIWVSGATTQRQGRTLVAVADIVPADHGPFALNRGDLRITVIGSRMAIELDPCTG